MDAIDLILLPRLALDCTALPASTRSQIAHEAGIPEWMLCSTQVAVPSDRNIRLWELVEHSLADPNVALRAGRSCAPGQLGLNDYLFDTAPTARVGFERAGANVDVLTTNFTLSATDGSAEIGFDQSIVRGDGRGRELAMQVALAAMVTRARRRTGGTVRPVRVSLRQRAPRRHDQFVETFGTRTIDFGAPTDRLVFRTGDLDRPLTTADPVLAGILLRHSESAVLRAPVVTCAEQLHHVLLAMFGTGPITMDRAAATMVTSARSLQRALATEGTTWRRELNHARRVWLTSRSGPALTQNALAHSLGYSDARALRRARRRWAAENDHD